jgi:hypothetical protein
MEIKSIVVLVLENQQGIFIGKHFSGKNENKWGFPSLSMTQGDERPQDTASKLFEVCTFGMYGSVSSSKKRCEFIGKTVHGLLVYSVNVEMELEKKIGNVSKYLQKCFPVGALPQGLIPWKKCSLIDLRDSTMKNPTVKNLTKKNLTKRTLDDITQETLEYLRATRAPILFSLQELV